MFEPSEAQFIQHICSHPGDNVAVGVYGDWLEEQGSDKAVRVQNFYRGVPLADNFYELANQLSPEQQVICAILLAKDVLSVYEAAVPDNFAPRRAIAAAERGEVTQEILDDAWDAWVAATDAAAYYVARAAAAANAVARAADAAADAAAATAAYAVNAAAYHASQVYPDKRNTYLLVFSSFILFGCNAVVLE